MKALSRVYRATDAHWVGDGFPVRTVFSYNTHGVDISPFLLLDYAGPAEFPPASPPRGVGEHPHRGFETVTIVYQGEVEHRDSAGNRGRIGPGDVQWMTAAKGIVHEEMHGRAFAAQGGTIEMIQLWVNLPAKDKMSPPRYQEIVARAIPTVSLGKGGSIARIIAGSYEGKTGPARTFTPVNVWDLRLAAGHKVDLRLRDGFTALLFVLKGSVSMNGAETVRTAELATFERAGERIVLVPHEDTMLLAMNGEPIDEPVVGYGPFVMNTHEEIAQAVADYGAGRL
ncbi:MAG TPA: pirin family protein [Alphaproteobacteria bacterium]|jgi:redox-sensitive bicupin YhaK (pirin superfamily)|nr:pirin family protein [Alphaproteobacteria bacterium]